ncbi:MAG: serine protease [Longimicrobiales bacterium]
MPEFKTLFHNTEADPGVGGHGRPLPDSDADPGIGGRGRPLPAVRAVAAMLLVGFAAAGCTRYVALEGDPQGYYQTAFPGQDISGQIDRAFRAVKRIQVTGVYEHYRFSPGDAPMEGDRLGADVLARAVDTFTSSNTRQASAVQIARAGRRVTLLSNQHAIHFPDTLVEYFQGTGRRPPGAREPRVIERVSVRRRQENFLVDWENIQPFEVLARNVPADLALIGASYPAGTESLALSVLEVPVGNANRLSWGSFVYVLGHPGGYPVVTRGIVSEPLRPATTSFLIDGLWNEGISGGPILAVRGETGGLEWVGIARAAAGRVEYRLTPETEAMDDMTDERMLYEGRIYLERAQRILYGISLSVSMNTIREFLDRNREDLGILGWQVPRY